MDKSEKIYIAGPKGMVNSAIEKILKEQGFNQIISRTKEKLDLLDNKAVADFFKSEKPDYVFLPSYKSGSIQANINYPAEFIYENLMVQNNVIHNAYLNQVKKLLFFAASCVYPKESPQPIKEEYLLTSEPESTNLAYAIAKISGIIMCQAHNKQYKTNFISVIPATIYGPNDAFDLEKSHVLPAMLRKFHEAKINNQKEVMFWGSGAPQREFIYVDDLAEACVFIINSNTGYDLINVGPGTDISTKDLAEKIKVITGFQGEIKWDITKPDGAKQRLLGASRLRSLGWNYKVDLESGLVKTYEWFIENYASLN